MNNRHIRFSILQMSLFILGLAGFPDQALPGQVSQEQLADIERKLAAAVLHGDIATLERTYAEDFRFTHSTGDVQTKAEWLKESSETNYRERSIDSIKVELHGDWAITTGRIHIRTDSSQPRWQEFTIGYVRVYTFRAGRFVSRQALFRHQRARRCNDV